MNCSCPDPQFGRSSEKLDVDQQAFAFDEVQTGLGAIEAELEAAKPASERRAARPRKAFPKHLERVEIIIEPETVAALCPCGNCMPVRIGEDVSERLDGTPAKFRVFWNPMAARFVELEWHQLTRLR